MIRSCIIILILSGIHNGYSQVTAIPKDIPQIGLPAFKTAIPDVICEYLTYEPFDYTVDSPLEGLNKGEGFSSGWNVQNSNTDIPGYQVSSTPGSLGSGTLTVNGNHASGGKVYLKSGRSFDISGTGPFADYIADGESLIGSNNTGQSLWMSFLLSKNTSDNEEVAVYLHDNNIAWCDQCSAINRLGIGYFGSASDVGGQKKWSLSFNGTVYPGSENLIINDVALLVVEITFNTSNTLVELYVNPPNIAGTSPGKNADISINTTNPFEFKSLAYYGGDTDGRSSLDEIRMASTYQCTVPDSTIQYHIPPFAVITANPVSGTVPLTVNFDGSTSVDNGGGGLTYAWNFGDGTPVSNLVSPQHTYTVGGGTATVSLTVTDINGKFHTAYREIVIFNEDGTLPCQISVTSVQKADCTGNNAHVRINSDNNINIILTLSGDTISPAFNYEYTGLSTGIYQLTAEGNNGCFEAYDLYVEIDSNSCSGWVPPVCAMEIGTNLPGFADWEPHRAMRNFMKNTRGNAIPYTDACGCWSFSDSTNASIFSQMSFDSGGYPQYLPQTTSEGDIKLRYFISANGANMPPNKTYVLLYDGSGTFDLSGTLANIQYQANRIQFDLLGDGTFWFQLTQSTLGDHVRNIRVVRLEDEFANIADEPFYSEFLNKIEPFSVLRFMDWQHTNNNPMVSWSERTLPERFSYGTDNGVPYELIIQLANMTKKDIWICVPHAADDDFIMQMAQLFKNQLDPNIVIYLEYSNEVWNWIFGQAHYNIQNNPFGLNYGRAMALKAKKTFDIWHQVFSDEKCRVKRVLGIQGGFNWLSEQIIAQLSQDDWDYGSPTHYFGLDHEATGNPRLDILGSSATVGDIMANAQNNFNIFKETVKQDYRNIQILGKDVITYEGGQHFVGNVFGQPYDYQQAMWDAQKSMQMYDMYKNLHDTIRSWGCKLATNFSLAGAQESVYGSWGVMETIDIQPPYMNTAPKYQALLDSKPGSDCAKTIVWTGNKSNQWSDRCNWSNSRLPDEMSRVLIKTGYTYAPEVDITTTIGSIRIEAGANLTILGGNQLNVLDE